MVQTNHITDRNGHLRYKKAINDIPSCLTDIKDLSVRNSDDLESWLYIPIYNLDMALISHNFSTDHGVFNMIDHQI